MIGFIPTTYSVHEDEGSVSVAVSVLTGTLGRDVIVSLKTMNGTAVGRFPELLQEFLIHLRTFSHPSMQLGWTFPIHYST